MGLIILRKCVLYIISKLISLPLIGKIVLRLFKARIRDPEILYSLERRFTNARAIRLYIIGILIGLPVIGKIVVDIFKARIRDPRGLSGLEERLTSTRAIRLYVFGKYLCRSASAEAGKYLFYFGEVSVGISHLSHNLRYFLTECRQLNRTAVLNKAKLNPSHNHGIVLDTSWRKYYDIDRMAKQNGLHLIDYQEFRRKNFGQEDVLIVNGLRSITADENRKYPVIIRNVTRTVTKTAFYGMPGISFVDFLWSPRVASEAQKVLKQLPQAYCGLHIRRGDRLRHPLQVKITEPSYVLKKLREYNPDHLPVFLMTDERDRTLYKRPRISRQWPAVFQIAAHIVAAIDID